MNDAARPPASAVIGAQYPEPLWIQVTTLINDQVAKGILKPGGRLPPERQLTEELGVSRVTLRKALTHLVDVGVLSPSHGRGWYVAGARNGQTKEWPNRLESFSETAARMGLDASSQVLRAVTEPASLDLAETLGIPPGIPVLHLERVRLLGGVPIAIDATRIPEREAPGLLAHDFSSASLFDALESMGLEPVRADSTIEALAADEYVAGHLGIDIGDPVLAMYQVALDASDRKLFTSTIKYAGQRYRLRTSFVR